MTQEFVSTTKFDHQWNELGLSDDDRSELEEILMKNPQAGDVIPGTGGLRKLRVVQNGKGKRGGGRVLYVAFQRFETIYLMLMYGKNEKTDATPEEKRIMKQAIIRLEKELKQKSAKKK
jgi:hypothetical protein